MSFACNGDYVHEVTVDGRAFGQAVVNKFYFIYSAAGGGPTGGSSATFLTNFITLYRAQILSRMYIAYSVNRYWLRTIIGAIQVAAGPPAVFRNEYSNTLFDYREGDSVDDVGDLALAGTAAYLPMSNCLRAFKIPATPILRYFNKSYNRFGPFSTADLDLDSVDHDKWLPAFVTSWETGIDTFLSSNVLDLAATNGWDHAIYSTQYFGRVQKPLGFATYTAAINTESGDIKEFVGTQITRRYNPSGQYRGI